MSLESVKLEAQTSSGTRIRVPVLLERKDGRIYFWERGKENPDGAITGSVWRIELDGCYPAGRFRINADGTIGRGFPFLKMKGAR